MKVGDEVVLALWRDKIESFMNNGILAHDFTEDYDFEKLEPYLCIFSGIPMQYAEDVIEKFVALLFVYMADNRDFGANMHNKVLTKDLYKKLTKELKTAEDFLILVESEQDKEFTAKVKSLIANIQNMLDSKSVTKGMLKNILLKANKQFHLKKTYEIKDFIDNI